MKIHSDFIGGNIDVVRVTDAEVFLKNQIRDTMEDWFYWAFCIEGAQGKTLTIHFDKKWVGYYGPAVSHNLRDWHWLHSEEKVGASDTFTYTFGNEEKCVYFAHDMLYHPKHFEEFCSQHGLKIETLCFSETGYPVPYLVVGSGTETLLLTARHHACEATGNYVMEGVIDELLQHPLEGLKIIAVPFVDYDGVVHGDQGKSRNPWDHNRDYDAGKPSIYQTVATIREIAAREHIRYAFDFHSPWHLGNENDRVFIPRKHNESIKSEMRFANLFERAITPKALPYSAAHTFPADFSWNSSNTSCFGNYMYWTAGAELAFTLETPYFDVSGCPFSQEGARETGRCFAKALSRYHTRSAKLSFTGDILYQMPMNDLCKTGDTYDFKPLLSKIEPRLADADYLVGNVESPFAGEENEGYTHERYCFNTPEQALEALKESGFDVVTLANNHCMDRGQAGMLATLDACERAGLKHMGVYRTPAERQKVFVEEVRGIRVGFVNATYGTNAFAHHKFLDNDKKFMVRLTQPEETLEGAIDLLQPLEDIAAETDRLYSPTQESVRIYLEGLKNDVQTAKQKAEFVVVLLHSGGQYNVVPDAYTEMLTKKLREYGADLIVVNHPHIILPSSYEGAYFIAYCLGNLVSMEPGSAISSLINPDFSAIVNLYLQRDATGKVEHHVSFRLCQLFFDAPEKPPYVVDTYDQWCSNPTEEYANLILEYANRFAPGKGYSSPQAEYLIF